jgi:hypothetical protein
MWNGVLEFLKTTGGTALITVLIGGLFGQIITCSVQNRLKEREFQQAWLKARGDQALVAYKEYLDKEQETVTRAYGLVGSCITASSDLIEITGTGFDPAKSEGNEPHLKKQVDDIWSKYNEMDTQWGVEREKLGLLIGYYHHGRPEVYEAWGQVKESVTAYKDCAAKRYDEYLETRKLIDTTNVCQNEKQSLDQSLSHLTRTLDAARQYAWEGWESPKKLKSSLGEE